MVRTRHKLLGYLACIAISASAVAPVAASADTVPGRWCDRMLPTMPKFNGVMTIALKDDGQVVLRTKFGDGSSKVVQLQELAGSIYAKTGSPTGEKHRVVPSDGSLQLIDNDGIIRTATRLENTPKSGECR